jgi:hypothetical protein
MSELKEGIYGRLVTKRLRELPGGRGSEGLPAPVNALESDSLD